MVKVVNESKTSDFKEAAFTVLNAFKRPLYFDEIVEEAKRAGVYNGDTKLSKKLLDDDIAEHRQKSRFIKVGENLYSINSYVAKK